ncbi:MAG: Ig-like domain-containing protein [Anaerolineae bacterium]|nr:Ig-like domain-containing protein [Anaerolineae bacterium]
MRRPLWLLVVLVLALSGIVGAGSVRTVWSAGEAIAPQVIDTTPVRGEALPLAGNVTFYFDQPMDRASVQAALKVSPAVTGTLDWSDDMTATFRPAAPLDRAAEYTFTLTGAAKSATGVPLRDTFELRLRTVGFLEVTQVSPTNKTNEVETAPTITVIFNRPVVPLLTVDEMAKLPSPITITPAAEGKGEWQSTSIYTFKPTALKGGTPYTVTVNKGLTDITGAILPDDVTFSFTTALPKAIEVRIEPRVQIDNQNQIEKVLRDPKITLTFSQAMNTTAVESAFALVGPNNAAVPGTFSWNDKQQTLTFTPQNLLDYSAVYNVRIDQTKALNAAGTPLDKPFQQSFQTIDLPDIIKTNPVNNEQIDYFYSGTTFYFAAPMKLDNFKSRITINPPPLVTINEYSDNNGLMYGLSYSPEPATTTTVTLDVNGLTDRYGTPFTPNPRSTVYQVVAPGKIQIKYRTVPYPAEAGLRTNGYMGMYGAYRPQTSVFLAHRNINTVNLALSALPFNDFLRLSAVGNYDLFRNYRPAQTLRRWSVSVPNPPNALHYDQLTITDQGASQPVQAPQTVTCPGTPATRVGVGDVVVVTPDDPTPLRIRQTPGLKGVIVGQGRPGTQFNVVDGPVCTDGYLWWKLVSADGSLTGWGAEGDASGYFIGVVTKAAAPVPTQASATQAAGGALKPGAYFLEMNAPGVQNGSTRHMMLVATASVTIKVTDSQTLAWVTDLQSGQPLANVPVQFYQGSNNVVAPLGDPVQTDANGLVRFDLPQTINVDIQDVYAVVNDGKNLGVGISRWDLEIDPSYFKLPTNYNPLDVQVYLYSDRPLYRPGQPVYFRGMIRSQSDTTYTIGNLKTIPVRIVNDQNQPIYQADVPVDDFGVFSGNATLAADVPLGQYRIVAAPHGFSSGNQNLDYERYPQFNHFITVAEYRVPEFQVKVTSDPSQVVQGDTIKVTVNSSFFFGGAVSNASVTWTARAEGYTFAYKGSGNYNFTDYDADGTSGEEPLFGRFDPNIFKPIAEGNGTTDAQGNLVIELPASLRKAGQSQTVVVEATVTDESNQAISGRAAVVVNQGEFYIGAAAANYVGTANQSENWNLITVDWNSQPRPNTDVSVRVVERQWESRQIVSPVSGLQWQYTVKETPVADGVVRTGADGKTTFNFTPPRGGVYKLYATSRDSRGNQITTSAYMWVAGPGYIPWRQPADSRIDLKIDREQYKVGDSASILIASPFQGEATALITVERGKILKTEVVNVSSSSTIHKLPITPDMAPNAYVYVTLIKGVDADNPVAAFRVGIGTFNVDAERLKLNINVTSDKPQAGPGEKVNYTVRVTDYAGKPVKAALGMGLTDLAVLSLLPDTSTPILDYFYGEKPLGVRTGSVMTVNVDAITQEILKNLDALNNAKAIPGGGGGGGGGGGPEPDIFDARKNFVDTPLWETVKTNDNGEATVAVTLPDNLTTWRLDIRAVTQPTGELSTTLVGQLATDLLSTKPLIVRPVTPRFYVVGDNSTLLAVVNNNTGQDQDVTVRIDTKGVTLKDNAERTAKIANNGRMQFAWSIDVQDVSAVDVTFLASTADGKYTDAAKSAVGQGDNRTLPVVRYEAAETVSTAGVIGKDGGNRTEGITLPRRLNVTQGNLAIRVEPSLAASTTAALNVLKNYPYQCTEQTVSRFLPNLMTYRAYQQLGLDNPTLRDQAAEAVDDAVSRLESEQHGDGGWGWFVEDNSDPLVTAYVLMGLNEARSQGFKVDDQAINGAIGYIKKNLVELRDQSPTATLNRQAFLLYAVTLAKAGDQPRTQRLFDLRANLSQYGRAYLAMTFHLINPKNTGPTNTLISDLQNRAITSATGVHWQEDYADHINWNTDTRTTAIVLKALLQIQPNDQRLPDVVRWLMSARKADAWETTQETAWSVMALTDWMQTSGELKPNYAFDVALNGKALANQTATPETVQQVAQLQVAVKDLLANDLNRLTINRSAGPGVLYYTANLTAYLPVEQIQPLSRGITITRQYSLMADPDRKPITQANVGENIRVILTIIVPNDLNYAVINDPIPAGAEAINTGLATSQQNDRTGIELAMQDTRRGGGGGGGLSRGFTKVELRDDRTVLYAAFLPKGTHVFSYTIRGNVPGQYRVIPATGQEFYFPEVYGRSAGSVFTLTASQTDTISISTAKR